MTLGRLLLAWLPVAAWFGVAAWGAHRLVGTAASPAPTPASLFAVAVEALLVTLFGSLWFDSLGHGQWWLLFGLVGILAAGVPGRPPFVAVTVSVARYLGAGALLAWRLG
jgi:hypothetical protein